MFWFFGHELCGILTDQSGVKTASPELEGEVLTIGLPGKSLGQILGDGERQESLACCGLWGSKELDMTW